MEEIKRRTLRCICHDTAKLRTLMQVERTLREWGSRKSGFVKLPAVVFII